mmetsp:Transcript_144398/g.462664  ORF Transcript_144398/g.462664 Transcript_144398/m.462664 type:complete len:248 (-) Transcript_144398:230-973(-)
MATHHCLDLAIRRSHHGHGQLCILPNQRQFLCDGDFIKGQDGMSEVVVRLPRIAVPHLQRHGVTRFDLWQIDGIIPSRVQIILHHRRLKLRAQKAEELAFHERVGGVKPVRVGQAASRHDCNSQGPRENLRHWESIDYPRIHRQVSCRIARRRPLSSLHGHFRGPTLNTRPRVQHTSLHLAMAHEAKEQVAIRVLELSCAMRTPLLIQGTDIQHFATARNIHVDCLDRRPYDPRGGRRQLCRCCRRQ